MSILATPITFNGSVPFEVLAYNLAVDFLFVFELFTIAFSVWVCASTAFMVFSYFQNKPKRY